MSLYWIKKVNGKKERVWNYGRSRGLEETKNIIGDIKKEVDLLLKVNNKIKILDVGCGYGKTLLELKKIYGDKIFTFGINKESRWNLNLIRKFAIAERIFAKEEINKNLPKLIICDVDNGIPFKDNFFDFVFSQRTIQYISDKAKYLEELNRVASPKGIIITDIQDGSKDRPLELQHRWEIWNKSKKVNIHNLLSKKKNIYLYKEKKNPQDKVIKMKKNKNFGLNLKLLSSIDLHKINPDWWGKKSIFLLK
jgi:ubiquinone/menaquinone biosynthesis C-methylase UbiE